MSRVPPIHHPNEIRDNVNGNLDTLNKQVPCVNFINASYPTCLSRLTSSSDTPPFCISRKVLKQNGVIAIAPGCSKYLNADVILLGVVWGTTVNKRAVR